MQSEDEDMEEVQEQQPCSQPSTQGKSAQQDALTLVTQDTLPASLNSIQVSLQELEISGMTDDSSRIALLEHQFKTITSNFTIMMEKLSK